MSSTIQPQELRINNWLQSKEWRGYGQVKGVAVTKRGFKVKVNGYIHKCNPDSYFDLEPIPLTEEILVKAGFDPFGRDGWFSLPVTNEWSFIRVYSKYPQFVELSVNRHSLMPPGIKFLHELQNLFYSLTGRELEINL